MQAGANKAAYFVANKLEDIPWQGNVASVTGTKVTIIGGTNVGHLAGMTLTLLSKGADVVDVQEKFSICVILQGGEGAKKGDLVRREPEKN